MRLNDKKQILFIINPISGVGKKNIIPPLIEKYLSKEQFNYEIIYTKRRNHGHEIAKINRDKYDAIVAVGGDGSVNEIGSALVGSDCALGIIPSGSGNGLARHLKIPLKPAKAIQRINGFEKFKIDTGLVNDKVFLGTCGFGFDAYIAKKFDDFHKRGFLSYIKLVIKEFSKYKQPSYQIQINGKKIERKAFMCSIANSSQFGNGFTISPKSNIRDGKFELIFLDKVKWPQFFLLGYRFFTGSIHKSRYFESHEFDTSAHLKADSNHDIFFHIDGEPLKEGTEFDIYLNKLSLNMI